MNYILKFINFINKHHRGISMKMSNPRGINCIRVIKVKLPRRETKHFPF